MNVDGSYQRWGSKVLEGAHYEHYDIIDSHGKVTRVVYNKDKDAWSCPCEASVHNMECGHVRAAQRQRDAS